MASAVSPCTCRSALGHLIALDPSWMDSGASRETQSARPALGRGWHRSRQLVCRSALWSKHWPLGDGTHSKISVGAWPLPVHAQSAVPLRTRHLAGLGPLLRQRRGLCWMSDLLGVRDENGGLREKLFSTIVSACFSCQSWARFMIQTRHYIEEMTISPVQLNQSGSPPTGESLWLQMRETGQPGSRTTHFYDARPIRPFLGQGTAGMELGVTTRILLLKDKMPIKP